MKQVTTNTSDKSIDCETATFGANSAWNRLIESYPRNAEEKTTALDSKNKTSYVKNELDKNHHTPKQVRQY